MKRFFSCLLISGTILAGLAALIIFVWIPQAATKAFGPPAAGLSAVQKIRLSYVLAANKSELLTPANPAAKPRRFEVKEGESAAEVALRLQREGFIPNAKAFTAYLIYKGLDRRIHNGKFKLSASRPPVEIAETLQFPLKPAAILVVLAGWRREEIAAAIPSSGLGITSREFLEATKSAKGYPLPFKVPPHATLEGFLLPDKYTLPRNATAEFVAKTMVERAADALSPKWQAKVRAQGLTPYQGLILASIVQRETKNTAEMPLIASVYYNRLRRGMFLEADPTVQYALGKAPNWWPAPLNLNNLRVQSPYNTYLHKGLPPAPIDNPGRAALEAVSAPAKSNYLFFRAACQGPPHHIFSQSYKEHLQKACP